MRRPLFWILVLGLMAWAPCAADTNGQRPLADALDANGRLIPGQNGSYDANGYVMLTEPGQQPTFVPAAKSSMVTYWDNRFPYPGFNAGGSVRSIFIDGDDVYFGGSFTSVNSVAVNRVVKYTKSTGVWTPLLQAGTTNPGLYLSTGTGTVYALCKVGSYLLCGGYFPAYTAGASTVTHLAVWNTSTSTWSATVANPSGEVDAILPHPNGTEFIVGGVWANIGGDTTLHRCVRYNPTANTFTGIGTSATRPNNQIYCMSLSPDGTTLYVGGSFTATYTRVARCTLSTETWATMGSGFSSGSVRAILANGSDVYAGGSFTTSGATTVNYIARWNGTAWVAMGNDGGSSPGLNLTVYSLAWFNGELHVGGSFSYTGSGSLMGTYIPYFAKFNGSQFVSPGAAAPVNSFVWALTPDGATTLFAGGDFDRTGTASASVNDTVLNRAGKWSGSAWSAVGAGQGIQATSTVRALAASGGNIWAGGDFDTAGSRRPSRLGYWNGTGWMPVGTAGSSVGAIVYAVTVDGSNVYVGGSFTTLCGKPANNIAYWDGSAFQTMGPAAPNDGLKGTVYAILVDGGVVYAGGAFTGPGGSTGNILNRVAYFDSGAGVWTALGTGISTSPTETVYALAKYNGKIYAGGFFSTANSAPGDNMAVWNGSSWGPVGAGLNSAVMVLAVNPNISSSPLYVGGSFTALFGGVAGTLKGLATYNGSAYTELGGGVSGGTPAVNALAFVGPHVYAGGVFTMAGATAASNIALWDGSAWSALATGTDGAIYALAVNSSGLHAGGSFANAGGAPSSKFGIWAPPASLLVSPATAFTFAGRPTGPFYPQLAAIVLYNVGFSPLTWTGAGTQTWLNLSSGGGVINGAGGAQITAGINANTLAIGNYPDTITFTNSTNGAGNTARGVALVVRGPDGDFNADDKVDLIWQNGANGDVSVWFMNGKDYAAGSYLATVTDTNWKIAGSADFNNDGKMDVFWRNGSTGDCVIWYFDGVNYLSSGLPVNVSTTWIVAGFNDFDHDGYTDVLWRNTSTGDMAVWFLGAGIIREVQGMGAVPTNWQIAGLGDFNADNWNDILWRGPAGDVAIWYLTGGLNVSGQAWVGNVADANWKIAGVMDFYGDRSQDILWRYDVNGSGDLSLWIMSGSTLSSAVALWPPSVTDTAWQIAN